MKHRLVVTTILSLVLGSLPAWATLPRFNPNDILRADQLNDIVDYILTLPGPNPPPRDIPVDCTVGETIGGALEQANPGDSILVTGTCNEAVRIIKDGITLNGQGQTIVDGGGSQQSAIVIDGAQRVTVQGLIAQHGEGEGHGVLARRGAAVILHSVTAENNDKEGIRIDENSTAQLINCTASLNGRDGIFVFRSSHATLGGTIVSQTNRRFGIHVSTGGVGFIVTGATVTVSDNTSNGILVNVNATFVLNSNSVITLVVRDNRNRGILVSENSDLTVFNGTLTVQNNANGGVQALQGSFMRFSLPSSGGTLAVQIIGNQGRGVQVDQNAGARIVGGTDASIEIHDNRGDGIGVFSDSYLDLQNVTVNHNGLDGGAGINLSLSTATLTNVQLLDHANGSGLNLGAGSRVTANQLTVMNNSNANIFAPGISIHNKSSLNLSGTTDNPSVIRGNLGPGGGLNLSNGSTASLNTVQILNNGNPDTDSTGGIAVSNKSSLSLSNSIVSGNQGRHAGISLFNGSSANLGTVEISGHANVFAGLWVDAGSSAFGKALTVTNNGGHGINVSGKSFFQLFTNSTISGNQASGVNLFLGSSANLDRVTISDHPNANAWALQLSVGSSVSVNNSTITNNAGGGINLFNGSILNASHSIVSNNQGTQNGIGLFDNCSASLDNVQLSGHPNANSALGIGLNSTVHANDLTVTQNGHHGIFVGETSGFVSDRGLMVTSNSGFGMGVDESHLRLQNATITGNSGTDLNASFGARLSLNTPNTIGTIFCDDTVLRRVDGTRVPCL